MGLAIQESQPTETTATKEAMVNVPENEDRTEAIKRQVEYYFSRQNLLQDTFLLSKMDKDHFVDVSIIAQFKMIKQLTTDVDLILKSVTGSDKVVIDNEKKRIKPAGTIERTTLILRNIPSTASEESVKSLLASAEIKEFVSIRSDVGDNWFVSFESEEQTRTALTQVKGLKWDGKAIGCAIKSESLLKGLAFVPASAMQYHCAIPYGEGNGSYRSGGRRSNNGGRRNAGVNDNNDVRRSSGGKKPKSRSGLPGKDGANDSQSPKSESKPLAPQPPPNLSDFPALGANGESTTGADANSAASTPPQCPTPPLSGGSATPTEGASAQKGKLSYAQMALASVGNTNNATAKAS